MDKDLNDEKKRDGRKRPRTTGATPAEHGGAPGSPNSQSRRRHQSQDSITAESVSSGNSAAAFPPGHLASEYAFDRQLASRISASEALSMAQGSAAFQSARMRAMHELPNMSAAAAASTSTGDQNDAFAFGNLRVQQASGFFESAAASLYASQLQSALLARNLQLGNLSLAMGGQTSADLLDSLRHRNLGVSLPHYPSIGPVGHNLSALAAATAAPGSMMSEPRGALLPDGALMQQRNSWLEQNHQQLLSTSQGQRGGSGGSEGPGNLNYAASLPMTQLGSSLRASLGGKSNVQPPFADYMGLPVQDLPVILCLSDDSLKLSEHQVLLRQQIEVFRASEDDISTHTRGRNKPIVINQVGIRCRHCAHLPISKRQRGSAYFPATTIGVYQAAQNMSTTHIQCGLCKEMPESLKTQFAQLLGRKNICSGAGRKHWAKRAEILGLVDTEDGIRFYKDIKKEEN